MRNRYFFQLGSSQFLEIGPDGGGIPPGYEYFRRAFAEIERSGRVSGLTFVLVLNAAVDIPVYGPDVVVVMIGEEDFRVPPYAHRVRAVFRSFGERPYLDRRPGADMTSVAHLLQWLRCWGHRARSGLSARLGARRAGEGWAPAPCWPIPPGYDDQLDLDPPPILERTRDVAFEGSIGVRRAAGFSVKDLIGSARSRSRSAMVESLGRYREARPGRNVLLTVTTDYFASRKAGPEAYSRKLADTKICVVPRGNLAETCRYLQALRYGCVVVAEPQPDHWFYRGSPAFTLRSWDGLPALLDRLLDDPALLEERSRAALAWWEAVGSEAVAGTYMAETLRRMTAVEAVAEAPPSPRVGAAMET
jgi:hypothetical protein